MRTVRQGDVLFIRRDRAPRKGLNKQDGVIAQGTATGHTHRLRQDQKSRLVDIESCLYVVARATAYVDHEEHTTITLSPGTWEIRRQRESVPEGFRQIED